MKKTIGVKERMKSSAEHAGHGPYGHESLFILRILRKQGLTCICTS